MDNKYYTPSIEDIRVGYECECLWQRPEPKTWDRIKITETDTEKYLELSVEDVLRRVKSNEIRTPYLTKEQIEAEGWRNVTHHYKKEDYNLMLPYDDKYLIRVFKGIEPIFQGHCPSINELRIITKLLGI
jgi:hypothetical protein